MHKTECEVRTAIEAEVQLYAEAGVTLAWGNSHRTGEAIVTLGDARESVYFSRNCARVDKTHVVGRLRRALRKIGADQVDMHALRQKQQSAPKDRLRERAEAVGDLNAEDDTTPQNVVPDPPQPVAEEDETVQQLNGQSEVTPRRGRGRPRGTKRPRFTNDESARVGLLLHTHGTYDGTRYDYAEGWSDERVVNEVRPRSGALADTVAAIRIKAYGRTQSEIESAKAPKKNPLLARIEEMEAALASLRAENQLLWQRVVDLEGAVLGDVRAAA